MQEKKKGKKIANSLLHISGSEIVNAFGVALVLLSSYEEVEGCVFEESDLKCIQLLQLDSSTTT